MGRFSVRAWEQRTTWDDDRKGTANTCGSLEGMATEYPLVLPVWELLFVAGRYLGASTIVNAELAAVEFATAEIEPLLRY